MGGRWAFWAGCPAECEGGRLWVSTQPLAVPSIPGCMLGPPAPLVPSHQGAQHPCAALLGSRWGPPAPLGVCWGTQCLWVHVGAPNPPGYSPGYRPVCVSGLPAPLGFAFGAPSTPGHPSWACVGTPSTLGIPSLPRCCTQPSFFPPRAPIRLFPTSLPRGAPAAPRGGCGR